MYRNKFLSLILIGLLSITVRSFAQNDITDSSSEVTISPFVAGIVGGGMASVGQSQTSPEIIYTTYSYQADTSYQFQPLVGVEGGFQFLLPSCWIIQTGLLYNQIFPFTGQGTSEIGYSPNTSTLYNYSYTLHTQQLFESTKLAYAVTKYFHPFLQIGLGAALNQSSGFQSSIVVDNGQSNLPATYASHSNANFAYQIGIGFDADISNHWLAGISYQFTDVGPANFGNGQVVNSVDNQPINYTFKQSNLQVQQLIGQVTYLF